MVRLTHLAPFSASSLRANVTFSSQRREIERLFGYLETSINWKKTRAALPAASSTNFLKRDMATERTQLLTGWRNTFSEKQIEQANSDCPELCLG